MLRREKRTQAEQQRKEKESYDRQHHVELDRTGYPSATGPVIRNVQHLVRQRWYVQDESLVSPFSTKGANSILQVGR